jgi:hypothetical protein
MFDGKQSQTEIDAVIRECKTLIIENHDQSFRDPALANLAHGRLMECVRNLRGRVGSIASLTVLLSDENPRVRSAAASLLLWDAPAAAEATLLELSQRDDLVGLVAGEVLREWRAGQRKPPF